MDIETRLVKAADNASGGLSPALDRSTTFDRWPAAAPPYARSTSPTAEALEELLGGLEDAEALVFASGMTAWSCMCLALLESGRPLAIPTVGYYELELFGSGVLARFGVEIRRYVPGDLDGLARAADGAALAVVETPANPTMAVTDIEQAAAAVHAGGGVLVVDNTMGTPLGQRPLDLGADLSWQSGTKYLAGHSDTLAGVVTGRDAGLVDRVRAVRRMTGSILAPDGAWLLHRGIRSLAVRFPRQCATAQSLAERLAAHPAVSAVHYPGLPTHPGHDVAARQMKRLFGGLLAFELPSGEGAMHVENSLQLVGRATSLGGVETLCERRARFEPEGRVPEGLLRVAIGLEHADDVWADFEQALAGLPAAAEIETSISTRA